ncbi:hypothetical protein I203_108036 [Kwoniella mangroviensis CBS 8507]|uniref:hypothetical protein n=1 Tax=Kwoniella mangroviensis CBS 8507 TaxID=1296122 RepID=UPI00080D5E0C|nr:uncharacterized protein I203_04930 [Kwoniella mangroviensis CBS 8507]OCF65910.1 hypothetical protein I203_04930 [Kwoniella mangroviensis CBS 8507]
MIYRMQSSNLIGHQLTQRTLRRALHACAKRAAEQTSPKGKGKAISDTLFAPSTRSTTPQTSTPKIAPGLKPTIPTYTSSPTHSRGWQAFEASWAYHSSSSTKISKFLRDKVKEGSMGLVEVRTIFEKPINFNPILRLLGCGFTAFIGFIWFWLPPPLAEEVGYQTFWNSKPDSGYTTKIWGTFKHFLFVQTPYWALGGAAIGVYRLTKNLNIVTKLEQCRIRLSPISTPTSAGAAEEIYLRMSTVKKDLMGRWSGEPRDLRLSDVRVLPVKGPHERNGDYILNLHIKDSTKGTFADGQPYIVDTRYRKYLDKSDQPYVLSPSRLRHVFGRWEGFD